MDVIAFATLGIFVAGITVGFFSPLDVAFALGTCRLVFLVEKNQCWTFRAACICFEREMPYSVKEEDVKPVLHESLRQPHQIPIKCLLLIPRCDVAEEQVLIIVIDLDDIELVGIILYRVHGLIR